MKPDSLPVSLAAALTLAIAVTVTTAGCISADSPDSPPAGSPKPEGGVPPKPGQLGLRVDAARQFRTRGDAEPLVLAVTLTNGEGGAAVPLNPVLFKLQLASGLLILPTSVRSSDLVWVDGREPDLGSALAGGSSYAGWRLAFDVDAQVDPPVKLLFEIPGVTEAGVTVGDGRSASAVVNLEPCAPCGVVCTYLDRDEQHCGACGRSALGDVSCRDGAFTCEKSSDALCTNAQGSYCVDVHGWDPDNCGACGATAPRGGGCESGVPTCFGGATLCGDTCVETYYDEANCGACGRVCGDELECRSGACTGTISMAPSNAVGRSCTQICAEAGGTCSSPAAVGGFKCPDNEYYYVEFPCGAPFQLSINSSLGICTYEGIGYTLDCDCG